MECLIHHSLAMVGHSKLEVASTSRVQTSHVDPDDGWILFGYATEETKDAMSLTLPISTRAGKATTDVHKNGDGVKTARQLTIDYGSE